MDPPAPPPPSIKPSLKPSIAEKTPSLGKTPSVKGPTSVKPGAAPKKDDDDDANLVELKPGLILPGKRENWVVVEELGRGGFGAVYKVHPQDKPTKIYAMKTEMRNDEEVLVLKVEVEVLKKMADISSTHFCRIVGRGRTEKFNFLVMTCVGKPLSDLRKKRPHGKFSLSTAVRVGLQGNFAIGRAEDKDQRTIYVLDFGMCRKYRTPKGELRYPRQMCEFRGTVRYASLNCHLGKEMSREDDLEVWMYMVVEISRGALPWKSKQDKDDVKKHKELLRNPVERRRFFEECPHEFEKAFTYIITIEYWDKPDYDYLRLLFGRILKEKAMRMDDPFDWEEAEGSRHSSRRRSLTGGGVMKPPTIKTPRKRVGVPADVKNPPKTNMSDKVDSKQDMK